MRQAIGFIRQGAEAAKWGRLAHDYTERVRALGPLDWDRQFESKED